jgi:hypothetical protein
LLQINELCYENDGEVGKVNYGNRQSLPIFTGNSPSKAKQMCPEVFSIRRFRTTYSPKNCNKNTPKTTYSDIVKTGICMCKPICTGIIPDPKIHSTKTEARPVKNNTLAHQTSNNNSGTLNTNNDTPRIKINTPYNNNDTPKNTLCNNNGSSYNYNGLTNIIGIPNNNNGTSSNITDISDNASTRSITGITNNIGRRNNTCVQNNNDPPNDIDTHSYSESSNDNTDTPSNTNTPNTQHHRYTYDYPCLLIQKGCINTNIDPNNSKLYDPQYLLLQCGDIETNPGPNKSIIQRNSKSTKYSKTPPNKNNTLPIIVMLIQILILLKSITQSKTNIDAHTPGNHSLDIKTVTIHIVIYRVSMIHKHYRLCFWHEKKRKNYHNTHMSVLILLLLLLGGDIEINPGPKSIYPCGICEEAVNDSQRAFCCDGCDIWYHKTCISMCTQDFEHLENRSISYICYKCNVPNYISNLQHSYTLDTTNLFDLLSNTSGDSLSPNNNLNRQFIPKYHSSPRGIPKARIPATITINDLTDHNNLLSDNENENYNPLV